MSTFFDTRLLADVTEAAHNRAWLPGPTYLREVGALLADLREAGQRHGVAAKAWDWVGQPACDRRALPGPLQPATADHVRARRAAASCPPCLAWVSDLHG